MPPLNQAEVRAEIARAIAHIPDWNTDVPTGQVKAVVENGWVTLEYAFQREEVERLVRNVLGVLGVTNNIEVKPRVTGETERPGAQS